MTGTTAARTDGRAGRGRWVRGMFGRVAGRYDLLNHLLSFNLDQRWRAARWSGLRRFWRARRPRAGSVLRHRRRAPGAAKPGADRRSSAAISAIPCWWRRSAKSRTGNWEPPLFEADALVLPLRDDSLDLITAAFGFRNLANYEKGLEELRRVLKAGRRGGDSRILAADQSRLRRAVRIFFHPRSAMGGRHGLRFARRLFVSCRSRSSKFPGAPKIWPSPCAAGFETGGVRAHDRRSGGAAFGVEVGPNRIGGIEGREVRQRRYFAQRPIIGERLLVCRWLFGVIDNEHFDGRLCRF